MKRRHTDLTVLVAGDWVAAAMAWALFFYYRKIYVVKDWFRDLHYTDLDMQLFTGLLTLPWVWVLLYALSGSYQDIYRIRLPHSKFKSCEAGVPLSSVYSFSSAEQIRFVIKIPLKLKSSDDQ